MRFLIAAAAGTVLTGLVVWHHFRNTPSRRIRNLMHRSKAAHQLKRYEESLALATESCELALTLVPGSRAHIDALVHIGGVHSAQNCHDEGMKSLDEALSVAEAAYGKSSAELVDLLHARAECLELSGAELALAAAELARARDIRRAVHGENSIQAAFGCINLASVLIRGSQEEGCPSDRRSMLVDKAVGLTLEGASVADALGDSDNAAEFLSEVLSLLDAEEALANRANEAIERLKDKFLSVTGEEWEALAGDELGE